MVADPIKSKRGPNSSDRRPTARSQSRSASHRISSVRRSRSMSDPSSSSDSKYNYSPDTIPQYPFSEACGRRQHRSRGQGYSAELHGVLFITSLYRGQHGEPQIYPGSTGPRAPADRRLTAGTSSMYYLYTLGSAYKNPRYFSCVRDDGNIVITLPPT